MTTLNNDTNNFFNTSKWLNDKLQNFLLSKLEYVVSFAVCLFVFLISFSTGFSSLEYKYYDAYLKLKPEIHQNEDIMMILIDDRSFEEIGTYPWSRDIVADMLIRLREFSAKSLVFDIEFLNPSSQGVNPNYVNNTLPQEYRAVQEEVTTSFSDFAQAIGQKQIPVSQAEIIGKEISDYINPKMNDLYRSITSNIFRDNDEYFAWTIQFFGNAFLTINSFEVNTLDDSKEAINYSYDNVLYDNVIDPKNYITKRNDIVRKRQQRAYGIGPALLELMKSSVGAGFPNVVVDDDGVRRRYQPLVEYKGKYVAQLVFEPLLRIMKPEQIISNKYSLVLKKALPPDGSSDIRKDFTIPLDSEGNILINWVKTPFVDSFKSDSAFFLHYLDTIEDTLLFHLQSIAGLGIRTSRGYLAYHEIASYLLGEYAELAKMKTQLLQGESDDFDEYFKRRTTLFADMNELVSGEYTKEIYETFDAVRVTANDETLYVDVQKQIENLFEVFASDYKLYMNEFSRLQAEYANSFCIIGNSASATTDLGVTPFYGFYPNMGTHANLYNTIVSESFITPLPRYVTVLFMIISSFLFALLFRRLKTLNARFLSGTAFLIAVVIILYVIFAFFQIYIESLAILVSLIFVFIIVTISRFILSEKDKDFLRKAFSTYLSGDIIDEIIKDPNKLKLGGQEKELTAIFTDVQSFSSLSEKVTPTQLVSILNKYLSRMSDIVLDNKGTIDKFEGDAIIAFYGAPVDNPEHAKMAVTSAIRMKQAEAELNKVLVESGEAPNALLTRIGINSGPMVVGNMGTDAKMNYTIMGNDVNLAARLEGVNKVYGTWILASESSFKKAGQGFLGRRLDRVRVVGINTPVQLYNVIGFESEMPDNIIEGITVFHSALDMYLERNFKGAIAEFKKVIEIIPDDPPSLLYMDRARKLMTSGVPDEWDGVVNMTSK